MWRSDRSRDPAARLSDDPSPEAYDQVKSEYLSRRKCRLNARNDGAVILLAGTEYDRGVDKGGYDLSALQARAMAHRGRVSAAAAIVETDEDFLVWMMRMAGESPTFTSLLSHAAETGWRVLLTDLGTGGYAFDAELKLIELDHQGLNPAALARSAFFRHEMLLSFLAALRAAEQDDVTRDDIYAFRPEAFLMARRAAEADIQTIIILAGWELRAAGHADVWRHLIGGERGDLALTFLKTLERDPSAIYSGLALFRVFSAWYGDDRRVAACDHDALEDLDLLIDDEGAGALGRKALDADWVESRAVLPDGQGYLEGRGMDIVSGPDYCSVRDPINEAHLFQVVYDTKTTTRGGVPFRDAALARKIFPET